MKFAKCLDGFAGKSRVNQRQARWDGGWRNARVRTTEIITIRDLRAIFE